MPAPLPRTVKALGLVSLLNDASSEMIYPLLPSFLVNTLGAGAEVLGMVEGTAEAANSLLKIASGWLADRSPRRKPLILSGYLLSGLSRPLMAVAASPLAVLGIRLLDRAGKGARTAPRDALVAEVTPAGDRGRAYGFHRALDNAGALVGPLAAALALSFRRDIRSVFTLAALPAAASVAVLAVAVREGPRAPSAPRPGGPEAASSVPRPFLLYLVALGVFTLGNSSDAFLLLRAQDSGVSLGALPLVWAFHNGVRVALSTAGGRLSDRIGRRTAIVAGWTIYALAYAGFAVATRPLHILALFGLYGLHYALTEGPERALVVDLVDPRHRGYAFGLYHAVSGALLLPASLLTGMLWRSFGAPTALGTGALLAVVAAALLAFVLRPAGGEGVRPQGKVLSVLARPPRDI